MLIKLLAIAAAIQSSVESGGKAPVIIVELASTVVLPADNLQGSEAEAGFDSPLWKTPLAIDESAILKEPVQATAGGMSRQFGPADLLWRAQIISAADPELARGALYCGTRMSHGQWDDSEAVYIAFRHNELYKQTPRLCLLDKDQDGRFDAAVAVGKISTGPIISSIAPKTYQQTESRPIPGSTLEIRLDKGSLMQGRTLLLDGYFLGTKIDSVGIKMRPRAGGKITHYRNWRPVSSRAYPAVQDFGDLQVSILSYDAQRQRVRARFDRAFYRTPVIFEEKGALIIPIVR